MVECKYRITLPSQDNDGVEAGMDEALGVNDAKKHDRFAVPSIVVGKLNQSFDCGLCALLTQNDIGPMECLQPEYSEETCPDIAHLRDQNS